MTYQEILKAAGMTDEQITAATSNPVVGKAFESMMTQAESAKAEGARLKQEAETKDAKVREFWNKEATPKIDEAYSKVAQKEAEAAFYRTQADEAKKMGYIAADAPGFEGKRGADGKFVAKENEVPGSAGVSKEYIDKIGGQTVESFWAAQDIANEYQHLFGQPLLNMQALATEARNGGKNLRAHVEEKFGFQKKRDERVAAAQKEHDDKIRAETTEANKKEFAEKYGSNPDARTPVVSSFSKFKKTETGGLDRLAWSKGEKGDVREKIRQEAIKAEVVH